MQTPRTRQSDQDSRSVLHSLLGEAAPWRDLLERYGSGRTVAHRCCGGHHAGGMGEVDVIA